MSMKRLSKAVKKGNVDEFEIGDVVRWTAAGTYTYAAIKTAIGWVSTSRYNNGHVPATMTFEEFLRVMAKPETTDVAVASAWTPITGEPRKRGKRERVPFDGTTGSASRAQP